MLEVDERVARPQALPQLFASDELPGPLQQALENLEWLVLEIHEYARLSQLARAHVQLEHAKSNDASQLCGGGFHSHLCRLATMHLTAQDSTRTVL